MLLGIVIIVLEVGRVLHPGALPADQRTGLE